MKKCSVLMFTVSVFLFLFPMYTWAECQGDLDCDGDVDAQDLLVLASNFGSKNCGPCALTVNSEDYRTPVGMIKTFNVMPFYQGAPQPFILTIIEDENFTTWAYEDNSYINYYADREEYYDSSGVLYNTCLHDPSELNPLSDDGLKRVNQSWGGYYVSTCDDGNNRVNVHIYTLLDIEDVTVPAGTFQNCLKIFRDRGGISSTIIWYAPGIGSIKRVYQGGMIYELTSYQIQG